MSALSLPSPRTAAGNEPIAEPAGNSGGGEDFGVAPDGWALHTVDGSRAAHVEHTVAITDSGPRILTLH